MKNAQRLFLHSTTVIHTKWKSIKFLIDRYSVLFRIKKVQCLLYITINFRFYLLFPNTKLLNRISTMRQQLNAFLVSIILSIPKI